MHKKILLVSLAALVALGISAGLAAAHAAEVRTPAQGGASVSSKILPIPLPPVRVCEYAAPQNGCRLVPGPNYNEATQCGLIVQCEGSGLDNPAPITIMPLSGRGSANAAMVKRAHAGTCGSMYMESTDGTYCVKFDAYSDAAISMQGEGGASLASSNTATAPSNGVETSASASIRTRASIPTLFIEPKAASNASVTFAARNSKEVKIDTPAAQGSITVAPKEGLRVLIGNKEREISVEKDATNGSITVSHGSVTSTVAREDTLKVDAEGNLLLSGTAIKIMPDTAAARAREELGGVSAMQTIELKNTHSTAQAGTEATSSASYEITATKDAKLFGFIKIPASVTVYVSAETGGVIRVQKPWWSFIASF